LAQKGASAHTDWAGEEARQRFVAFYREQLRELMTGYGPIDILWYDGCIPAPFDGEETNAMVRALQPEILINERNGEPFDFRNCEQTVNPKPGPWEACMTLNSNWGWHAGDTHWKTPGDVIELLINCASKGGNLLLNVGPMADGTLPPESTAILGEVGSWLTRNRESLPDSERHGFAWNNSCQVTVRGKRIYLHFHNQPGPEFCWAETNTTVLAARFLATGNPIAFAQDGTRLTLKNLPVPLPDSPVTTIVLDTDDPPVPATEQTTFWIPD
jgi:alpha-L-fucosidase